MYTVWEAGDYDSPTRGAGWEIPAESQGEDGPNWAHDAEDAAVEWAWARYRSAASPPKSVTVVVQDEHGDVSRWTLMMQRRLEIEVEEADDVCASDEADHD